MLINSEFSVIKMTALQDANDYCTACQSQTDESWFSVPPHRYKDKRTQDLYNSHFFAYLNELLETGE